MPSGQYPYIDIAALDAVRTRFAAGDAIAILAPALDEVIWANGAGAQLFGSSDIESIIGAEPQIGFAAKRQIAATSGYPRIGKDRAITVRLASGMTSRAIAFVASEIGLPGGEDAILLAVPAAAVGARSPADVASRAISGLDQAGQYAAIVDAGGGIVTASTGFERLGIGSDTLAELVAEVRGDRLVKRMIAAATQPLPAGFVRLTDDPATHLLVVIDEAVPEHATAPQEPANSQEPDGNRGATAALAEISNAASSSEPALAAVDGSADATEAAQSAAVDEGVAVAPGVSSQAEARPDDAVAIPSQAVAAEAEPASGEPHDAEGSDPLDDTAAAAGEAVNPAEPNDIWESGAAEQPLPEVSGTVEAEAEPAEAPVDARAAETTRGLETIPAKPGTIEAVHDSKPADGNDEVQGLNDATARVASERAAVEAATNDAGKADEEAAAAAEHVIDEAAEATVEQGQPAREAVAGAAAQIAVDRAAAPVRFVWKTDADGRFAAISEEFSTAVGASAAAVIGRSFQDVSQSFGLDPDGEIGRLLDRRDTWSGRTVLWPVAGTDLRVPVDLAALPVYDRARKFSGFRGFGVARAADAVVDPDAAGLALVASPAESAISADAAPADEPAGEFDGDAAVAPPDDPFQGEVPILSIVPKQDRRYSDKVIRLAEHRPPNGEKGLSPGERIAFREIGDRLKKDSGTAETGTPPLRGDNDQTPPSGSTEAEPPAIEELTATASTDAQQGPVQSAADGSEAAEPEAPAPPEPEIADGAQDAAPAATEDGQDTSAVEDDIGPSEIEALRAGNEMAGAADATPAQADESKSLHEPPAAVPSERAKPAEAADQAAQTVDAELAMYGEAELAAAEAEHLAEQQAASEAGADIRDDARNVGEQIGETPAETGEPQSGIGTEPVASLADSAVEPAKPPVEQSQEVEAVAAVADPAPQTDAAGIDQAATDSGADKDGVSDEAEEASPTVAQNSNAGSVQGPDVDDHDEGGVLTEGDASGDTLPSEAAAPIVEFADAGTYLPSAFSHGAAERVPVDTSILEQLPVPVLIHYGDALHYANREFLELTGYDTVDHLQAAGGLGELFGEPYPREDGASADDEAAPGRKLRLRTSEGLEYPVEAFLQAVPWGSGKALLLSLRRSWRQPVSYPVAATPQITDPDLEARISEMRAIVDTATDGVILITSDGAIRSISRPAEALFGFDTAELAGKPFTSLFAIESQRAARDYLNGLSENGVASVLNDGREVIGREAQGRFIPLFMTIGRLPGDNGYCAVLRDITQWKRAEEELTQARAQAERASSQKTDFLARVSHEIRTPLNAIIGFSELMLDEKFGPIGSDRYRDYLRDINRSGNHVLDLVNDLLDISKIEAGQQEMSYEAVSLNDTIAETVAMMQPQANRERVIIRSSFASRLPEVVADLRSVRQIALNLLSNAIRYTQAGGQVIVSTAYESSGDVVMRVRDTGVGMSQAEIEQALKPFKQINSLKRTRGDGTGLGLPLTKAMVEANRARFMINSTPGEGTLVEITFPSTRVLAE